MIETMMRKRFKKLLKGTGVHFDRIETGATQTGYPDIHFYSGINFDYSFAGWMELKHVQSFRSPHIIIPWRPGQLTRGRFFVEADIILWLCVLADDTNAIKFIPGYCWEERYSYAGLKPFRVFNIDKMTSLELINILKEDQYGWVC